MTRNGQTTKMLRPIVSGRSAKQQYATLRPADFASREITSASTSLSPSRRITPQKSVSRPRSICLRQSRLRCFFGSARACLRFICRLTARQSKGCGEPPNSNSGADAFAGEGDVVAGGVLDQVHGLVGHAEDFLAGAGVAGERSQAEAGGDFDIQAFIGEKC